MKKRRARQSLAARGGPYVGLLGGSFNPAHDGHLHISRQAMMRLGLDSVWWLVSPQNPLKSSDGMSSADERLDTARRTAARDNRIVVTDIERLLDTRYTIDTVQALKKIFPERRFVWLMGADNLIQIPAWKGWKTLFGTIPIAVFDRAPYSVGALAGEAARLFAINRLTGANARKLAKQKPPCWAYFNMPRHPASATDIRRQNG